MSSLPPLSARMHISTNTARTRMRKQTNKQAKKLSRPCARSLFFLVLVHTQVLFLPISALYGHNIKDKVPKERCGWYDGPALFDVSTSAALRAPPPCFLIAPGLCCCCCCCCWH